MCCICVCVGGGGEYLGLICMYIIKNLAGAVVFVHVTLITRSFCVLCVNVYLYVLTLMAINDMQTCC